jgi:recombinational DNA repair protein (RecF pathway)
MSYAIYKTDAIILRVTPQGEANTDVTFLTKDLGKIVARVQAARKYESKMRMHLTRYNHVVIDLVRGKSVWRLTGVHALDPLNVFRDEGFLHAWYRITSLAEHLIRGEEAHPEVFELLVEIGKWEGKTEGLELFGVIQVLDLLGYWHGEKLSSSPTGEVLGSLLENKKSLVKMINESIEATQIVV